jgi:hypothetical protein
MFGGEFVVRPQVAGSISTRKIWNVGVALIKRAVRHWPKGPAAAPTPVSALPASRKERR